MVRMGEITAVDGDYLEVTFCHQQDCGQCHACENGQKLSSIRFKSAYAEGDDLHLAVHRNVQVMQRR